MHTLIWESLREQKGHYFKRHKGRGIWDAEGFELKGKSKSKWLAYYMGMRSAVFDEWLKMQMEDDKDALVIHIGCGMDSRVERVGTRRYLWYDVDFSDVIEERKRYYEETDYYHMVASDARQNEWINMLPANKRAIVVMEGVSMYFRREELKQLLSALKEHFVQINLLMDSYTEFAARASKYKNPINDVGVTEVYGIDDPVVLAENTGIRFVKEHEMTPGHFINELSGVERCIFQKVFGGKFSKKMYRLYEYKNV